MPVREILYVEALREALREEMLRDPTVFVMGEDIIAWGGAWGVLKGLAEEFGEKRVRDTPISEAAFIGAGIGAAMTGLKPIIEMNFADFLFVAMDQIVNQAAKLRFMTGGQARLPMVIRAAVGAGLSTGPHHSQSPEAIFMHVAGLKVALPSTPYDAKGLFKSAVRDGNPVLFLEHKVLYRMKGHVPEEEYTVPFGVADIKRKGEDITIVATSLMVHKALAAAEKLENERIRTEVVDPRTLVPLDKQTILNSVKKTSRLLIVEEDCKTCGVGAEIAAIVAEEALDYLDAPIKRVAALDSSVPFSPALESRFIPDENSIIKSVREIFS
jgi:pyruvate dehydrogenase E1 component beta subunit